MPDYHTSKVTALNTLFVIAYIISPKYLLPLCTDSFPKEDYDTTSRVEVYHFRADL